MIQVTSQKLTQYHRNDTEQQLLTEYNKKLKKRKKKGKEKRKEKREKLYHNSSNM